MPFAFLADVPREIRDYIYTFVLASPTGAVSLSPWTIEVARSLSILRTCHQIRRECKDIIWAHTGLAIHSSTRLSDKLETIKGRRNVQQLKICLELLDWDELDWIAKSVRPLLDWCQVGKLQSITLSASWEKPCGLDEFKEMLHLRKNGESTDGRLVQGQYKHTKFILNTGWPRFTHWGKQRWLREMLLDPNGTDKVLKEIHGIFGGDLFIDGQLCFRDGEQVTNVAGLLNPRDGEVVILPSRSRVIHRIEVSL